MKAKNIEEVLVIIDNLIDRFKKENNPLGYFAAIYKMTTLKVRDGCRNNEFENNERMERMDVIFANRYFEAITAFYNNEKPTDPWQATFDAIDNKNLVVDQHFFLSANAHIKFDLGIAAATTCPSDEILAFHNDFNKMNAVLASLYDTVNYDIAKIWHPMYKILKWFDKFIKLLENLYMIKERDNAWENAVKIATADSSERNEIINKMELSMGRAGYEISHPSWILKTIFTIISKQEKGTVAERIAIFESSTLQ